MAKRCEVCGRGSTKGAKRSHAKNKTLKRQNINLQTKKTDGKKYKVCTKCIKTSKKYIAEAAEIMEADQTMEA